MAHDDTEGWEAFFPGDTSAALDTFLPTSDAARPPVVERSAAERAKRGFTQGTEIVQIARAQYEVVRGDDSKTYAVSQATPGIALSLLDDTLLGTLATVYYDEKGQAPSSAALSEALRVLHGDALRATEKRIYLRAGAQGDRVIIDRGTPTGHAVRIGPDGWELLERSPILFRRTNATNVMPPPTRGGSLDRLSEVLNVDERRFRLIVAYILAAYMPDIAHPILALSGEQGTAKTTAGRLILSFIDPSPSGASLQSPPRSPDDWAIAARNYYGLGLDNVSKLPPWLQDALCRAVTGDAYSRRALYSDDSINILTFRRPIVITTIDPGALQGDVADRLLTIELLPIRPTERRTEADVQAELEAHRSGILGALFDLLANVLAVLPSVTLAEKPRMADWALVLSALDQVTGWNTLADYLTSTVDAAHDVLDADSFGTALVAFVRSHGYWEGTCLQLLHALGGTDRHPADWPIHGKGVQSRLKRITPALQADGVTVAKRVERSNQGSVYVLTNTSAPTCPTCDLPLSAATTASGATTHPSCGQPTLDDEEPF